MSPPEEPSAEWNDPPPPAVDHGHFRLLVYIPDDSTVGMSIIVQES